MTEKCDNLIRTDIEIAKNAFMKLNKVSRIRKVLLERKKRELYSYVALILVCRKECEHHTHR